MGVTNIQANVAPKGMAADKLTWLYVRVSCKNDQNGR
jgi:hypothetical protein